MKKLLSLLLAFVMLMSAASALAEALPAEIPALPQVGDVVNGFEALEIRDFPMVGAIVVLFEHQKTGAKLTYVANDDNNRAFQLSFLTRPIDNTGLPHVFEHSTLSGSEKYPSANLFMNLSYQTYNTYMNAYTVDAMTCYPIGSLSEEQLLKYADYYTDSCLHPNVMTNESIYRTEAWRYRMASMEDDLTIEGTVYTEMLGATTLARAALYNANGFTFPGSALTLDQGGNPDYIPEMTWDSLKAYHELFYHPSNCMAYLYGYFENYAAFLALLDEAFAPYEKAEYHYEDAEYAPITAPAENKVGFPMAEGTDTANQSVIYYYILCPGMKGDVAQEDLIDNLCSLLNEDASVMMQNLKKALPTGSFSCGREVAAPDDAIVFTASNVNEDDGPLFKETVDAALKEVAENGFPKDMVDSAVASLQLSIKLAPETVDPIDGLLYSIAYQYATTGNPFAYLDDLAAMDHITEWNDQGLFNTAAAQWLVEPALYTLTTTYPQPGQKEVHDAALAEHLAQVKAEMTEEEKQAIIDFTNAEAEEDDASALVAQLQAVTVESLPEEVREYQVNDETDENGLRHIDAVAGVDGVGKVSLYIDAAALPQEDIHYLRLFTRLLGQLDTDAHTKEELDVLSARYLYDRTIGVDVSGNKDAYHPYLFLGWTAMDEDLAAGYDLMNELVFHTQFTDVQTLSERVSAQKAYVRNTITNAPYVALYARQEGVGDPRSRYYDYLNYTAYYTFLEEVEQQLAAEPETVTARLQNVQSFFANRSGAVATFAGSEASIAVNAPLVDAFFADLGSEERTYPAYDLPTPPVREGIAVDGNIQYNCNCAAFSQIGVEPDYSLNVIGSLIADQLLIPVLRDQMGAYSVWCGTDGDYAMYLISYRDPNVKATFDLYDSIPEKLAAMELTQEQIDGYIMQQYSSLAKPAGELGGAVTAMTNILHRRPADEKLQQMRAYKSVTPESVKAAAEAYAKLMEKGCRGTVGPIGTLQANSDLYDAIQNPFHTEDLSQVSFSDVAEDNEHHDAIYAAFTSGMMAAKEEGLFAPDEPATAGDFLGGLYMLIGGGSNDPDACKETLVGYGLVAADQDLNAELHEDLLCGLLTAIGAEMTTDTPDAAVTRADLADLFVQLSGN